MISMGTLLRDTITWVDLPSMKNGSKAMATIPKPNPIALWMKPAKNAIAAIVASRVNSATTTRVAPRPVFLYRIGQRRLPINREGIKAMLATQVQV